MRSLRFSPFSATAVLAVALASVFWVALAVSALESEDIPQSGIAEAQVLDVAPPSIQPILHEYIEVMRGCGPYYDGEECVHSYAGPGEEYGVVNRLRRGIVLKVEHAVLNDLRAWYEVTFDESIRYPERVAREQYVLAEQVRHFYDDGVEVLARGENASTTKHIIVDRSEQKLYAYEDNVLFMEAIISTGIQLTPTPRGTFTIYRRTPSRYMQGPLPGVSDQYYDLPGVPWNLYFTPEGGVIHGAYWHDKFGRTWSHGCVNLALPDAQRLYEWAEVGTQVLVRD